MYINYLVTYSIASLTALLDDTGTTVLNINFSAVYIRFLYSFARGKFAKSLTGLFSHLPPYYPPVVILS